MKLTEFAELIASLGLPLSYYQFHESVPTPFLIYYNPAQTSISADNKVIANKKEILLELYFVEKDLALEEKIEDLLNENEIYYSDVDEIYIETEGVFKRTYYITI